MYTISWSSDISCLHSFYAGIHSVVVPLIFSTRIITVGVSSLSFRCCVAVCPWCISTDIASSFISNFFSANKRADLSCFSGTNIACLISSLCIRVHICPNLFWIIHKALHTLCILISLQQQPEKYFPPIHIPKASLKNSSCGPEIAIDGPGTSRKYTGWPKIVDVLGLIKLPTMAPSVLPRALSTAGSNYFSKWSTRNTYRGISLSTFSLLLLGREKIWWQTSPCLCQYHSILELYVVLMNWGYKVENHVLLYQFNYYFQHHSYTYIFKLCHA